MNKHDKLLNIVFLWIVLIYILYLSIDLFKNNDILTGIKILLLIIMAMVIGCFIKLIDLKEELMKARSNK